MTIEKDIDITSARSVSTSDELSPGKEQSPGTLTMVSHPLSASNFTSRIDDDSFRKSHYTLSDDEIEPLLSGYTVKDVKSLLDEIVADKSVKKILRRQAVARVVKNQPHPTKNFTTYDRKNDDVPGSFTDRVQFPVFTLSAIMTPPLSFIPFMDAFYPTSVKEDAPVSTFIVFATVSLIAFLYSLFAIHGNHRGIYGERTDLTLDEFRGEQERKKRQILNEKKHQLAALTVELSGENSAVSVPQVTQDYRDAVARMASYETDLNKALKYPAFNDISVPAVQGMVKQLRVCKSKFAVLSASSANNFAEDVAELWVRIQTVEEEAKRIGLKSMNAEELKLLEKIKGLAAHAGDPTYSDDVRTGFYQQLKISVNKLNENRTVVPTKIATEIEQKAALLLEQTKEEGAHV